GKKVAIIGGGNTAIDTARSALRMGAKPFIIYRRTEAEMPAIRSEVIEAEKEGIEISHLTTPIKIFVENGKVTGLECVKNRTGAPDNRGRRVPIEIKGSQFFTEADMVITAVGEIPELSFAPKGIDLENQRIATNESLETGRKGVFAGGDVTFPLRSIAHAIGAGKKASIAIDRYFQKSSLEDIINTIQIGDGASLSMKSYLHKQDPSKRRSLEVVRFKDINLAYFEHMPRQELDTISIAERISSVKEVRSGFSKETALKEVRRCFNCGMCNLCENCYLFCPDLAVMKQNKGRPNVIDYDHCKGCGICAEECPRDAVYMEREEG
ncbi:MAG: FAD-dependent oxidoreductase, partial [Candidatus Mariimomonas ferrooxydans]